MEPVAIMNLCKGEEIAAIMMSGQIPGTGHYKLLAKKRIDGRFEWAHFVQRANGYKEKMYKGEVESEDELKILIDIMNKHLIKIFGPNAEMKPGKPSFYTLDGKELKPGNA
jgi:hypothetical protein